MKVVLLAGGKGTRISEESQFRPKPMVEIGGMPILWHIMKSYYTYGFNDFIICAGYKQHMIKDYFANYFLRMADVTFDFKNGGCDVITHDSNVEQWKVTVVDTGVDTMTGGRIKRIQKYIDDETFMLTYGDGVCDVNIDKLMAFHKQHGRLATLTAVIQNQQKGVLSVDEIGEVKSFREKQANKNTIINAGFMVLEPKIFDYIEGDQTVFESDVLEKLADEGQLMSYCHPGFWQCMDNVREKNLLESLWANAEAPWKIW